jgi:hypothetical protein
MTTTYNNDRPPSVLSNGATVEYWAESHPGGDGLRLNGIALCHWPHGVGDWVTWSLYRDEDGEWHAEQGHYCVDIMEAVEDFRYRTGVRLSVTSVST